LGKVFARLTQHLQGGAHLALSAHEARQVKRAARVLGSQSAGALGVDGGLLNMGGRAVGVLQGELDTSQEEGNLVGLDLHAKLKLLAGAFAVAQAGQRQAVQDARGSHVGGAGADALRDVKHAFELVGAVVEQEFGFQ
jgi:hypothetical protein